MCYLAAQQLANLFAKLPFAGNSIRGMGGYGMAACGCKTDVRMAFD
jgi:hypothetical protein